jgi:hypothetical protein
VVRGPESSTTFVPSLMSARSLALLVVLGRAPSKVPFQAWTADFRSRVVDSMVCIAAMIEAPSARVGVVRERRLRTKERKMVVFMIMLRMARKTMDDFDGL